MTKPGTAAAARRFIVTGGPGAGKTTLIDALAALGYATQAEVGRAVIREQHAVDGDALPWRDRARFAQEMLRRELARHAATQDAPGAVVFDRGIPDVVGYLRLCGLPVPAEADRAARAWRYAAPVFIAPPWPEIFTQDAQRKQDLDEAVRTYECMVAVYTAYDYPLVELPRDTVEVRSAFLQQWLGPPGE